MDGSRTGRCRRWDEDIGPQAASLSSSAALLCRHLAFPCALDMLHTGLGTCRDVAKSQDVVRAIDCSHSF
ncbi:hypothetical protein LshimejAT787_1300610 [Lyophyllum shimeji]|uniref:Uncharacterized protein n=1 Tax=Lyophyllum shimeji TaxID=47721 RepID=A0A9P3PW88_LYOSH|nr:hypothetical protein LshimejAT787_1300610 [Lyophyllum shimeji]